MASSDLNLLFGIHALQLNFISRDTLVSAMTEWILARDKSLGDMLEAMGHLDAPRRQMLDSLVQEDVRQHLEGVQKSLAAMSSIDAVRNSGDLGLGVAGSSMGASDKFDQAAETVIQSAAQSDQSAGGTLRR